jgi:hypothetical protein
MTTRRSMLSSCLLVLATACGGGGGGGGGGGNSTTTFSLEDGSFGRLVEDDSGAHALSPLTIVARDPETGAVLPDTVQPLGPGVDVAKLVPLDPERPTLVPRDTTLVLEFSAAVDPGSVVTDEVTEAGTVTAPGSIQLRYRDGRGAAARIDVDGKRVLVTAIPSLRASPIWFDKQGEARLEPSGSLELRLADDEALRLRGANGETLIARDDHLGESDHPFALSAGNPELDFIQQEQLFDTPLTFHGFLPGARGAAHRAHVRLRRDARVRRRRCGHRERDRGSGRELQLRREGGRGEWADGTLILRPGLANQERRTVKSNTEHRVVIAGKFQQLPSDGDAYRLERLERFEPDPSDPIDPALFDPDDPQNDANRDLRSFAWFEEVNTSGDRSDVNGDGRTRYSAFERVPSLSVLKLRFDVPMTPAGPYEALGVVASASDPRPDPVGEVELEQDDLTLRWVPRHPEGAVSRVQGFVAGPAGTVAVRTARIRIVPEITFLEQQLSNDQLAAFEQSGVRGLLSRAGVAPGFPVGAFDPASVAIEYAFDFETEVPPTVQARDIGAVVHLFRGVPQVVTDPVSGRAQLQFHDRSDPYGPVSTEFNATPSGYLAPKVITSLSRVLDDQNPPPGDPFLPSSNFARAPLNGIFGARFQQVYPADHCLPGSELVGTTLDLTGLAWCPFGPLASPPERLRGHLDLRRQLADPAELRQPGPRGSARRSTRAASRTACARPIRRPELRGRAPGPGRPCAVPGGRGSAVHAAGHHAPVPALAHVPRHVHLRQRPEACCSSCACARSSTIVTFPGALPRERRRGLGAAALPRLQHRA